MIEKTVVLPPMTSAISVMTAVGEPRRPRQRAQRVAQIVEEVIDRGVRAAVADALGDLLDAAQLETSAAMGFLRRHALRDQVPRVLVEVKAQFLLELSIETATTEPRVAAAGACRYSASLSTSPIARAIRSHSDRSCSSRALPAFVRP